MDELYALLAQIKKRRNIHYKTLLAISQNPHTEDPKTLWAMFDEEDGDILDESAQLDKNSFNRLKQAMSNSSHFIVK